jgi:electron transfer flavoprotein alpha subunit
MKVRLLALIPVDLKEMLDPFATVAAAAIVAQGGVPIDAIILGQEPGQEDADAALAAGATRVWLVSHPGFAFGADSEQLVAAFAEALCAPGLDDAGDAALMLLPAGGTGEEIAARLAMRTGGVPLGRCTGIKFSDQGLIVTRAAYGGRAVATYLARGGACFATMQVSRTEKSVRATQKIGSEIRRMSLVRPLPGVEHIARKTVGERLAPLDGAKIVVCGGRGIGSADGFKVMEQLAACLDGAVGASLQAVDEGWAPVARQIGQSGKYVTADVYIGVGVSGTPQHLAGVSPDTRIVAINNDAGADIFRFAELGVVADWKEVLPAVIEQLRSGQKSEHGSGS